MSGVDAILLAAGGSMRMGHPKQLLEIDGVSLVRRAAQAALASACRRVFVVVGCEAEAVAVELRGLDVRTVLNEQWREGLGRSLAAGVAAVRTGGDDAPTGPDAIVVLLADQPAISAQVIDALIRRHEETGAGIVAAGYGGTVGVPALFGSRHFDELAALRGDRGAKPVILRHREDAEVVPVPDAAVDLDTPADHLRAEAARKAPRRPGR